MGLTVDRVAEVACGQCGQTVNVSGLNPFTTVRCLNCQAAVIVPAQLGHFRLLKIIGKGSISQVFAGLDQTLGRHVAIKVIHEKLASDPRGVQVCLEEARALASLNHPNVAHIHAIAKKDGQPYIVMELVDGDRLDLLIRNQAPLDEARVLRIAIDVAQGLAAAWGIGLMHGDVRPTHILLDKQDHAKLVDFGISRIVDVRKTHELYGMAQYVAPEVVLHGPVDFRVDMFSLGVTLYVALADLYPFQGQSIEQVLKARLDAPVQDLRTVQTSLHVETARLVAKLLQLDPGSRYPTYGELIEALQETLDNVEQGPSQPNVLELDEALHNAKPVRRRKKFKAKTAKRPLIWMGIAMGVIAIWIGGIVWWNATQREVIETYEALLPDTRWASLLGEIDVEADVVAGKWIRLGDSVAVEAIESGRVMVPYVPVGSYELNVEFTREGGDDAVCVYLPVGSNQAMLVLGSGPDQACGLQWINDQPVDQNNSGVTGASLENGQKYTVNVKVTSESIKAQIDVSLDGKPLTTWEGPRASLKVLPPWGMPESNVLGLGAAWSDVVFHSLDVRQLHGPQHSEADEDL